jgi:hypothetical protein
MPGDCVVTQEERAYRVWFDVGAILGRGLVSGFGCRLLAWCTRGGGVLLILRKERTGSVAKE